MDFSLLSKESIIFLMSGFFLKDFKKTKKAKRKRNGDVWLIFFNNQDDYKKKFKQTPKIFANLFETRGPVHFLLFDQPPIFRWIWNILIGKTVGKVKK